MSTNYYAVVNLCSHCGRRDRIHICKNHISFHCPVSYDDDGDAVLGPASWAEWKAWLTTRADHVIDEYGRALSVEDFIADVEADPPPGIDLVERRRSQYDWCVANDPGCVSAGPAVGKTWLDPDSGLTFTASEFS